MILSRMDTNQHSSRLSTFVLAALFFIFALPSNTSAQPPPPPAEAGAPTERSPLGPPFFESPKETRGKTQKNAGRDELRAAVRERLRETRDQLLREELKLTEGEIVRLSKILNTEFERSRREKRAARKARKALRKGLQDEKTSDTDLQHLIAEVRAHPMPEKSKLSSAALTEMESFLAPRKLAGVMVTLPPFQRKMRKIIERVRKGEKQMRKMGGGRRMNKKGRKRARRHQEEGSKP